MLLILFLLTNILEYILLYVVIAGKKYTQGVNDFINGYDFTPSGIFISISYIIYYVITI